MPRFHSTICSKRSRGAASLAPQIMSNSSRSLVLLPGSNKNAAVLFRRQRHHQRKRRGVTRILLPTAVAAFLLSLEPISGYQQASTLFRPRATAVAKPPADRVAILEEEGATSTGQPSSIRLCLPFAPSIVVGPTNDATAAILQYHHFQTSSSSSPCMFLASPPAARTKLVQTTIEQKTEAPSAGITGKQQKQLSEEGASLRVRRDRGVLGFRIHPSEEQEAVEQQSSGGSSSTRLNMRFVPPSSSNHNHPFAATAAAASSRVSKVDSVAWNLPEPMSLEASNSYSSSRSRSTESTATGPVTDIPWIPSTEEMESLTVLQLKSELGARGLKKTGRKAELLQRLQEWTEDQQRRGEQQQHLPRRNLLSSLNLSQAYGARESSSSPPSRKPPLPRLEANSLAEWARTVDLEPLLQRREEIHREKLQGKKKAAPAAPTKTVLPEDYLSVLQKVFDKPSSVSNREVKQMYAAAKHADQVGDRELSKRILQELKRATPHDARIYRRLSRLEKEEGNVVAARAILQEGLDLHPDNAFLWHGLGQLEGAVGNDAAQKTCYRKAIQVDPSLPHSYHALGTLEHLQGRVANAMKTLKKGIEYCPTNHRLHHALGDLYRDAKMLDRAQSSYQKALQHGPYVSHGFAYTALAYTAYEQQQQQQQPGGGGGAMDQCRRWLYKAVRQHKGRHANGWVALAQLEESEGNVDAARSACIAGIAQYERGLLELGYNNTATTNKKNSRQQQGGKPRTDDASFLLDPTTLKNQFLKYSIPTYRSGDRFFNVYRNWLRLEERYGTIETVEEVYDRASVAFPREWKLALDLAQHFVKLDIHDRARSQFAKACNRVGSRHAEPYRLFAEFEMSHGNFEQAQKILYLGATVVDSVREGVPELLFTWAVCEWHLGNLSYSDKLFDHALELLSGSTDQAAVGEVPSKKLRSLILYARARFEYFRDEHRRAQHFIGLCLKENLMPGGNARVWDLWAAVAHEMGDGALAQQCQEHAARARRKEEEGENGASGLSSIMLGMKGADMQHLMRRDPWHVKIFGSESHDRLLNVRLLPEKDRHLGPRRRRALSFD